MKNQRTIEEKYQKLDEISHCLTRPGRYLGSITPHTSETWVFDSSLKKMIKKEITWSPAFLKMFDEIISNSVDFSKTADGKHVTTIRVTIDKKTGRITVFDDGGIPVQKHKEHDQWIPSIIYELRAGSNFNDNEENADNIFGTGQNGEGAALTNIFSTEFSVTTADGKKKFQQVHTENSRVKTEPLISGSKQHFTEIAWVPDYAKIGMTGLDADNTAMLVKRIIDIAGCNPHLRVFLDGEQIKIKDFNDYVKLYQDDFVYDLNEHWKVALAHADEGFEHISFVNGTMTKLGGPHVDYITNQICTQLRAFFNKRHKVDVKPADIKNHFRVFIDAQIMRPRYDSQTKDNLITEVKNFGTTFAVTDKFIKQVLKSPIIESVLNWVKAKEHADMLAQMKKANKDANKANPRDVDKFSDANERRERHKCELYLAEGDSARKAIQSARGKNPYIGSFSLRGKPLNVMDAELKDILSNAEIKSMLTITGLEFGKEVKSKYDLRFGKIVIMTDQDLDGFHIRGLLLNFFSKFWPELFELGVIYYMNTPLYIAYEGKKEHEFLTEEEYHAWAEKGIKHKFEYYKGLGLFEAGQFKKLIDNRERYLIKIPKFNETDFDKINLAFSKDMADERKEWLSDVSYFRTYD